MTALQLAGYAWEVAAAAIVAYGFWDLWREWRDGHE